MHIRKNFFKKLSVIFILSLAIASFVNAADLTSSGFIIRDPVIGIMGGYGTSAGFKLISSGDKVLTGLGTSAGFIGHYGFLYYPYINEAVLTANANGSDGDLTWTATDTAQGWTVGGYKTGKASVPGGPYTYTDVGNVLLYTYDNLAPGDYCFVVQTYDALNFVIATSNEDCITILPTIVFDLDTEAGGGSGESSTPYAVGLGAISTTDTRVSGATDGVQMIVAEGETNAAGGVVVSVSNANGASGMKSTSVPGDDIGSADGAMVDGTENYGLCVATSGLIGFSRASPYNTGSCATDTETNNIQGLTTAGESILNSASAPVATAHAEIIVNGAISNVTAAHTDYTDTLTFIATSTF